RVISTVFMLFFLTIISDFVGLVGGGIVATLMFRIDAHQYWSSAWQVLVFQDVFTGLMKPVLFGFIIATVGCYYGISARGGTQGVGRATTQAVGASSVLIIAVDCLVAWGQVKPDSGRIYVLGEDVTTMSEEALFELRRNIGIVFQESALFDSLTVRENVAFRLMEEHDVSDEEIERRVREALSFVELEHTVDMFPLELSGGMRRRVAIARAIITHPEILLYD